MGNPLSPAHEFSLRIDVRPASDGYSLHYRHWRPVEPPRGWLLVLHGIQSHSGWYEYSATAFARAGWNVRIPDRRGSGMNSRQQTGVCPHLRFTHDVLHFLRDIQRERQQLQSVAPVLLTGISWGGKLALQIAQRFPELISALTLVTPGLISRIRPSPIDRIRLKIARRLGLQDRKISIPLQDAGLFTSVPEFQEMIRNDPLALHEVPLSFLYASQDLDRLNQQIRQIACPLLLLLAKEDRIIDNAKTCQLLQMKAPQFQLKEYAGARHTLELECCRDEFVADWVGWGETLLSSAGIEMPESILRELE